jgi:hypothetical protein
VIPPCLIELNCNATHGQQVRLFTIQQPEITNYKTLDFRKFIHPYNKDLMNANSATHSFGSRLIVAPSPKKSKNSAFLELRFY